MDVEVLRNLVEYKFAPEPLLAVQALANTYSFEDDEELLIDSASSERWLRDADLVDSRASVSESDQVELLELRETVRALLESNLSGQVTTRVSDRLDRIAAKHRVRFATDEDGTISLDLTPAATVGDLVAQLIGIIFEAQQKDQWRRLKICASDECRWAFYDSSRNRGGSWCRMEVCGNKINNRRYRERSS